MSLFKSYLIKMSGVLLISLCLITAFNMLIDPFVFFNSPAINKINVEKPEFLTHIRMTKAHQIRQIKPEIIILGSSRAEFGLNPDHPGFTLSSKPPYNLGLQSINIAETLSYLKHAQAIQPLKQVVLGLDFFMFNNNKSNEADFDKSRLAPNKLGWFKDIFRALLTYDGLHASINTVAQQHDKTVIKYFENGFRNDDNNWERIQKKGGHHQATINNEKYALKSLDGFTFFDFSTNSNNNKSLKTFTKILNFCEENNIDLHLFISPVHARKLQLLHQIGLWEAFDSWKKELVRSISLNTPQFSVWDFTGFNHITTEPFPSLTETNQQMRWYWESSHYKKETGDLILNRLFNLNTKNSLLDSSIFGTKLSTINIKEHLHNINLEQIVFQRNHPEIVEEIELMLKKTVSHRKKLIQLHSTLLPLAGLNEGLTISLSNKQANAY